MKGTVVKGIGGFYFVYDGASVVMGKARGNLKRNKELIYVGDVVDFDIDENDKDGECVIQRVIERKNYLTRPPVSNLDILMVVFSLVQPDVNYPVIDKLIAGCELAGIENIRTKSLGSNNKQNVVLATIDALSKLKSPEEVAKLRGLSVEEVVG